MLEKKQLRYIILFVSISSEHIFFHNVFTVFLSVSVSAPCKKNNKKKLIYITIIYSNIFRYIIYIY